MIDKENNIKKYMSISDFSRVSGLPVSVIRNATRSQYRNRICFRKEGTGANRKYWIDTDEFLNLLKKGAIK